MYRKLGFREVSPIHSIQWTASLHGAGRWPEAVPSRRQPANAIGHSQAAVLLQRENSLASLQTPGYYAVNPNGHSLSGRETLMNIGETIRNFRLQKGMSQGDIEKRTGLLRCYLSRVENGHTIPSLDTLAKIATAMDLPLAQFFSEGAGDNGSKMLPQLAEDEVRFLTQIRRYSPNLNDSDRKLVIAMVKKMAATAGR